MIFKRTCNIGKRDEMPQKSIHVGEIFNIQGIDFMMPFLIFYGNKHILLVVDYVSKWAQAIACCKSDDKVVIGVVHKNIMTMFGAPRAIVIDESTNFINKVSPRCLLDVE